MPRESSIVALGIGATPPLHVVRVGSGHYIRISIIITTSVRSNDFDFTTCECISIVSIDTKSNANSSEYISTN